MTSLADHIHIERRFQRSIRLDADIDQIAPLSGYILQSTAARALETTLTLKAAGQGAFTWTGPYGGGKSSLALAVAGLVSSDKAVVRHACQLLETVPGAAELGASPHGEWLSVAVTGRRADPVETLRDGIEGAVARAPGKARTRRPRLVDPAGRDILERIQRELEARPNGGVLLIVDELGKFLEASAEGLGDVHVFQDLAELANRSAGRFLLIGVLHQGFERYASRLGGQTQEDWAKIQGRFVDVPLVAAADEVIDLVSQAIITDIDHAYSLIDAKSVADKVALRRQAVPEDLARRLDGCWPLHPVTAAMLGPVSRRRFGQNERSVFGLLTSAEPNGVAAFLQTTKLEDRRTYDPAALWDYLRVNLEPAILASPDGHRWASAAEVVDRTQQFQSPQHERAAKSVALIDLFANGSGVTAALDLVATCLGDTAKKTEIILQDLIDASILIFRRHLDAYAVHAGSDFDIEHAVSERLAASEDLDVDTLNRLAKLRPILAKAHHHRTGTPRWFETSMVALSDSGLPNGSLNCQAEAAGAFRLVIPAGSLTLEEASEQVQRTTANVEAGLPIVVGLPPQFDRLKMLGREFVALGEVRDHHPMLEGDAIARREVAARLAQVSALLEEELRNGLEKAAWYAQGVQLDTNGKSLSMVATALADQVFCQAPVIQSELVNRQRPSSNTVAAIRPLLQAMIEGEGVAHFGIQGYSAERGLASTVLEGTGLYVRGGKEKTWAFVDPTEVQDHSFVPIWRAADTLFSDSEPTTLQTLYNVWEAPPLGLRRGVMSILAVAYILSRRDRLALYIEGIFQPVMDDLLIDRLLQNPADLSARLIKTGKQQKQALKTYGNFLKRISGQTVKTAPLPIAQGLVEFAFNLPNWSRHARGRLSTKAIKVRHALLHAHDPHRLLDDELPAALGRDHRNGADAVCEALVELHGAYDEMIMQLQDKLLGSLKHRGDGFEPLQRRAKGIEGEGGNDLKLRNFISRLTTFEGQIDEVAELCGLVAGLPVSQWRDLEPGRAAVQLGDFAYRFRRIELFGDQRDPTQTAVMVMAGVGEAEKSVVRRAQISLDAQRELRPLVKEITALLDKAGLEQDLLLAVLADVAQQRLEDDGEADITTPLADEGKS